MFPSYPICHILNAATERYLMQIYYLMATVNEGGWGNKSDCIMAVNSITAKLHTTVQVQSSPCRKIPFCIICGSHGSVEEVSSLLV